MNDSERFDRVCAVFEEVRELEGAEQRARLDELCAENDGIRAEVESMLGVHRTKSPLDQASDALLIDHLANAAAIERKPGIDRYEIGERLGAGGMGVVYSAQMRNPQRAVAIKVIRLGMDSERVIARFELERRALARMEHPNIASVLDAGVTRDGRPYFAMELVRGDSIVRYCDAHALSADERLRLFIQVCRAIQHAHQKGIIHRDIKPSNIILAEHDGVVSPKVIDFGIAKATQGDMKPEVTMTMQSQSLGTPAYMSPEQADQLIGDVDTRTDVYSLGVLLYELLTGTTPLMPDELTGKSYQEIVKSIRDKEPPKPSVRLYTLTNAGSTESTEPRAIISGQLSGDLDWIVMKCLEKDPSRRYDTVSGLCDDIDRHLGNEPVLARPASRVYLAQKFVRRHRGEVIAGSALLLVLVLGVIGTTIGMLWALDERAKAKQLAEAEIAAQIKANESAERAASEARAAEELSRFFIMDVLSAVDPSRTADMELTVREALENASENIEGRFEDRPDVESRIHNALGYLFGQLGEPQLAERHHIREWEIAEESNGEFSLNAAQMMHSVVGSLARQGRDAEAIELTQRELRIIDELATPEAEMLRPRAIGNLGALLVRTGRLVEAVPLLEDTLVSKRMQYGDRHPTTLSTISNLASVLGRIGDTERAFRLGLEAYEGRVAVLGDGDPRTFNSLNNLAHAYSRLGQYDQAIPLVRDGLERARERLGRDHPASLDLGISYAQLMLDSGEAKSAEQAIGDLLVELQSVEPSLSRDRSLTALSIQAATLSKLERFEEALAITEQIVQSAHMSYPDGNPRLIQFLRLRGEILTKDQQFELAEAILLESWSGTDLKVTASDQYRELLSALIELYETWHQAVPDDHYIQQAAVWRKRQENLSASN